jgi:Transposase
MSCFSLLRPALTAKETGMEILYRRCAGLDVHEKSVSACIRILKGKNQLEVVEATFPTFTEDLEQLRSWLVKNRIQRVAMESTGVYWRPVWNVLEQGGSLDLLLLNPQQDRPCGRGPHRRVGTVWLAASQLCSTGGDS